MATATDAALAAEAVAGIRSAADALDPHDPARVRVLVGLLDQAATLLARSPHARQNIGNASSPSIWPLLSQLWFQTSTAHSQCPDPDPARSLSLAGLTLSVAKFTRNLVAENEHNQTAAFENEPQIRNLVYLYSSYAATQDPALYPATRMLVQALSNMVTQNDILADALWSTYLALPEERLILTRLFASPDPRTLSSTFVLILNCIHDSAPRMRMTVEGPRGPRICLGLLDCVASLFEGEEASEQGRAFDIGYEIFSRFIEAGFGASLYTKVAVDCEAITPHQTTFLRLIDSYLHSSKHAHEVALAQQPGESGEGLLGLLAHVFMSLSTYTQSSIQCALGSHSPAPSAGASVDAPVDGSGVPLPKSDPDSQSSAPVPLQSLDLLLPKVCEALVLATQALTTIALRAEESAAERAPVLVATDAGPEGRRFPKTVIAAGSSSEGAGFVECLIATLRLVDAFVPRITFGKRVQRPTPAPTPADSRRGGFHDSGTAAIAAASASEAGENDRGDAPTDPAQDARAAQAFAHIKRDLVRLLGVLASHDRAVQDRVRACDGIPVVMNLCVVDDYNPYLREHAIFALRNILAGNLENQAVVEAIRPVGRWDEDKVLRELRSGE